MEFTRRTAVTTLIGAAAAALLPGELMARAQVSAAAAPDVHGAQTDEAVTGELAGARNTADQLTAPVLINGQGPFPFIVDTGASISCISQSLVQSLALPLQAARTVHTIVGARQQPVAMVEEMRIGARRQRKLRVLAAPLEDRAEAGVLAVDWLKGQRLTLDFVGNKLEFSASRSADPSVGEVMVPARKRHGQLTIIDADLGARRVSAMIDSGSELSLCNSNLLRLLERTQRTPAQRRTIELVTIMGEPFSGELVYLPFLRLGGLHLGNVPVVHTDAHVFRIWGLDDKPAILLGMDLLREFRAVTLDFGRAYVLFDMPHT